MGGLCDVFCFVGICKNKASIRKKIREKRFRDLSELGMMFEFTKMALFVNLIPSRIKQT